GLIDALVHRTWWVNVSLNAATRATWEELCQKDLFDRLVDNLKALQQAKRSRGAVQPLVYGSMVLTSKNVHELPRMPAFCRALGIDRFTGIPFYAYSYDYANRYGAGETFHRCRDGYEAVYAETVREAERHRVTLEIPLPRDRKQTQFGLEVRSLYDFAGIEEYPDRLSGLVDHLDYGQDSGSNCPEIWKGGYIGSTDRRQLTTGTHYMYPCLGPLASVDHSPQTTFDFTGG